MSSNYHIKYKDYTIQKSWGNQQNFEVRQTKSY